MIALRLAVSLAAASALVAGCSDATFTSLNDAFTATKKTATAASDVPLPAAAIATGLGALALVETLSARATAGAPALYRLAGVETLEVVNAANQVDMHAAYTSDTAADGTLSAAVTSLSGTVQGYTAEAEGAFTLTPAASARGRSAFTCRMAGSLAANGTTFTVKQFDVAATYPLPTTATRLGSCVFQQVEGGAVVSELEATLAINAKGRLVIDGSLTKDGRTTSLAQFGQDSVAAVSAR